ncbi:helix-turn-helix domain-containing protein [Myxococcota bacterium]
MRRRKRQERAGQYRSRAYRQLQKRLAMNVQGLRERRGWTQEQCAFRSNMSTRLLQRVEAEEANLTLTTLARLCEGLDADVVDLFAARRRRTRRT